jgi:glycosyltransferase involved in cell wall biosynthesis
MNRKVLIIQRFYYNFREGFFEYLSDINFDFDLLNATESKGRVKVHEDAKGKPFILNKFYFFIGKNYVIYPFLFFHLIRNNPKIIITEGGKNTVNNLQVLLYCLLFKRKYIVWDLGRGYAQFPDTIPRRLFMKVYNLILKHSYYIYGYNSQSRAYFKSLGVQDSKIVILNNTIDTRKIFANACLSTDIPAELRVQSIQGYTFFIYVGTLLRSKNIESMAALLRKLGDKYYLIIVGDGDKQYRSELETIFDKTNHIFVGYKKSDQLLPYYQLASFSILPGLGGLSINQSMAYGVPVVCCAADGAEKDLVYTDETGYIYADLDDACKYITSKSHEDWKNMGFKCKSLIRDSHSVESMMNKFIQYTNV